MRIRHPWLIKTVGLLAAWAVRLWMGTLRHRGGVLHEVDPRRPELEQRFIYAMWHDALLLPAFRYGGSQVCVLVSRHADGQMLQEVCRHLRMQVVEGSTTRHGIEAVRKILRQKARFHLAITPDGPRGPRRQVQPGVIYLAARTGMPIVPIGVGFQRPWRARSWDRFQVPRPWSYGTVVSGEPIVVPPEIGRDQMEEYRRRVEEALFRATEAAEQQAHAA